MKTYCSEVFDKFTFDFYCMEVKASDENEARKIINDNINRSFDVIYRCVPIKDGGENDDTND